MITRRLSPVILTLTLPIPSIAAQLELPIDDEVIAGSPRVGTLARKHTVLAGVRLNVTSIRDVQRLFGPSEVFRVADSDGANKAVCYVFPDSKNNAAVIFESGAMGGWETVTAITVAPKFLLKDVGSRCAKSARLSAQLATKGGLQLNLPGTELPRLGLQSGVINNRGILEFRFQHDQVVPPSDRASSAKPPEVRQISSGVLVGFSDNKVHWFQIYWTESY